jgi:riboflavin synthase
MFTGIITATLKVRRVHKEKGGVAVYVERPRGWNLKLGESVSVDGICSTIARLSSRYFAVVYMPETLSRTTAKEFAPGRVLNLERPLRIGARLHGHLVQGHVDARGTVTEVEKKGNSKVLTMRFPRELRKFVAPKGSICVNGVSLTVVTAGRDSCSVALIPYTVRHTNLGILKKGSRVNVEVDLVARYLVHAKKKL